MKIEKNGITYEWCPPWHCVGFREWFLWDWDTYFYPGFNGYSWNGPAVHSKGSRRLGFSVSIHIEITGEFYERECQLRKLWPEMPLDAFVYWHHRIGMGDPAPWLSTLIAFQGIQATRKLGYEV